MGDPSSLVPATLKSAVVAGEVASNDGAIAPGAPGVFTVWPSPRFCAQLGNWPSLGSPRNVPASGLTPSAAKWSVVGLWLKTYGSGLMKPRLANSSFVKLPVGPMGGAGVVPA